MLDFVKEETLVVCLLGQGLAPVSDSRDDEWDSVICPVRGGFGLDGGVFFGQQRCPRTIPFSCVVRQVVLV